MSWLVIVVIGAAGLLFGGIGGVVATALGRIAAETDAADRAAWERSRLT